MTKQQYELLRRCGNELEAWIDWAKANDRILKTEEKRQRKLLASVHEALRAWERGE